LAAPASRTGHEPIDGGIDVPVGCKYSRNFRARSLQCGRNGVCRSTTSVPVTVRIRHRWWRLGLARRVARWDALPTAACSALSLQLDAVCLRLVPSL